MSPACQGKPPFRRDTSYAVQCPSFGCSGTGYSFTHETVNGLTASALVDLDAHGILYVIGGAGMYDAMSPTRTRHFGGSVGAGIAIPVATHLRAVVEARWHGLAGVSSGPPWLVPVNIATSARTPRMTSLEFPEFSEQS